VLHQLLPDPRCAQRPAGENRPELQPDPAVIRDLRFPARARHGAAPAGPVPRAKAQARAHRGHRRRGRPARGKPDSRMSATADAPAVEAVMAADHVTKEFGGLVAVDDVTLDIPRQSIVSLIGPNGAGKTTLFNMLTGLYKPTSGRIVLNNRDVSRSRPDKITGMGVARTFQNIRLFGAMTAVENVMIGRHARMRASVFGSILRPPWIRREEREVSERARELLTYVGLRSRVFDQVASHLSYGDQRRVEIARALASDPILLL